MERFYKNHQGLIFLLGVLASVMAYAFTTFDTQKSVDQKIESVKALEKDHFEILEKRLDRIETKIDKLQGE